MANGVAIEAQGLLKVYEDLRAVDGVSLRVPHGIVFSLLGPNGAGKTTTVEILEGLRTPTAGSARVLGQDVIASYERIRRQVGILPQDFEPFDRLTPREHLRYFARLFGRSLDAKGLEGILQTVSLLERADVQARKLSGGEQRKLGISLALVGDPELLFLDEPTTGLDPAARRELWEVLRSLREGGRTVVLTTHYIEEAEALADDVAIMVKGKIVARGSPEDLIARYTTAREVRLIDVNGAAAETATADGLASEVRGRDLIVQVPASMNLGEFLGSLPQRGVTYRDVRTGQPSLEDVFLSVIGARLEEGGELQE